MKTFRELDKNVQGKLINYIRRYWREYLTKEELNEMIENVKDEWIKNIIGCEGAPSQALLDKWILEAK